MSIVRIGMSENKTYGEGYEAIFGEKKQKKKKATDAVKKPGGKKKAAGKKGKKA